MDELTPLMSKPCSPPLPATQGDSSYECMNAVVFTSLADNLKRNESESSVVVGVNPVSSQQARMEEIKLLKSRGIARKEGVKISPSEHLSDNNANASLKYLKETRKKHHIESMEYLQNPLSSQQAKVEHQARMEELKLLKLDGITKRNSLELSPGANSSDVNSSPNVVEEGKQTKHLLESMEYLHNPLSSQQAKIEHQARMEEVKLLKLNGITKEKSIYLSPSEGITDIDSFHSSQQSLKEARKKQHLESMEYLHRYQNNQVSSQKSRLPQNDYPPIISPSSSQDGLPELRDSPESMDRDDSDAMSFEPFDDVVEIDRLRLSVVHSASIISDTSDESKEDENQNDVDHKDCAEILVKSDSQNMEEDYHSDIIVSDQDSIHNICTGDSEGDAKCNEISTDEDNMMIMKEDKENTCQCDSDIDVILSDVNTDKVIINENHSQEITRENEPSKIVEIHSIDSSSQKRNAPMSVELHNVDSRVSSPRPQKHARGISKSRVAGNARPKRATHRSKPRFKNYISSSLSDRDASIDSYDSSHVTREYRNRHASDLSSQSSLESGFHRQPRRKANAVKTESSRSIASRKSVSSGRSR